MSKISYVSGNLHRISGQLSEATAKKIPPQEEETAEAGAPRSDKMVPASPREEVKPDYAELHKHLKHRFDELLRLKRDVNARIEEHHAFYSAEAEALHHRVMELEETVATLNSLRNALETSEIPDFADPDFKSKLTNALRIFENARLEDIKTVAKAEGAQPSARNANRSAAGSGDGSFTRLTAGDLFRKGFLFFLPLILTLLLSTLLLAAAFFAAWKIAF